MERTTSNRREFGVAALTAGTLMLSEIANGQSTGKLLSKKQLADLAATGKTAADHRKLADHYRAAAAKHEMEAQEHVELAAKYKANPTISEMKRPGSPDTVSHCLTYAEHCRKAAKTMSDMAAMHEEMAKNSK
jgi:hypothetical protein